MGILIKCAGSTFAPKYVIDTVEIPDVECEHEYDNACDAECNLCGATRAVTHNYVDGYCTLCGKKDPNKVWTIAEYPVTDNLQGLYDLGGTPEDSVVNHAQNPTYTPDGGTPKLEGDYEVKDNYVTFSGNAKEGRMLTYLRLPLEGGLTYVALFRVPYSVGDKLRERHIISNKSSSIAHLSLTNACMSFGKDNTSQSAVFDGGAINSENFVILAMTADANELRAVRYTNGSLNEIAKYSEAIDSWSVNAIQIGGNGTSVSYATAHISLAAVHTGKMSDEQLESICEFVKIYGEQKGLTIE